GTVDAHRFEEAVTAARAAAAAGDPAAAVTGYYEALRLWRGPALADAGETEWTHNERTRLEEARLAAVEDRLELLVDTGRHTEVVGKLDRLIADHPLRERLHRLLML